MELELQSLEYSSWNWVPFRNGTDFSSRWILELQFQVLQKMELFFQFYSKNGRNCGTFRSGTGTVPTYANTGAFDSDHSPLVLYSRLGFGIFANLGTEKNLLNFFFYFFSTLDFLMEFPFWGQAACNDATAAPGIASAIGMTSRNSRHMNEIKLKTPESRKVEKEEQIHKISSTSLKDLAIIIT